jgi:outer membrane protein OmpA-like peptidoglycan-associated protein
VSAAAALLGFLALGGPPAQEQPFEIRDLVFSTSDLVFDVRDLGGKVEDLTVKESATEIRIEMSADVLFDFDKADIKKEALPSLEKVAALLAQHPRGAVTIEGHTDGKGAPDYNQRLSVRRAESVSRWLKGRAELKGARFTVRGFGATKPVAPNRKPDGSDDPGGRQKNRRVEIAVSKKG